MAFGGPAKKKNNKKKGPAVKQPSKDSAQFDEWKQKDVEVRHCLVNAVTVSWGLFRSDIRELGSCLVIETNMHWLSKPG